MPVESVLINIFISCWVKRTSHSLLEVHWVDVVPAAAGDPLPAAALQPLPGLGPRPRPAPHVGDAALSSPSQPHRQLQHLIQKIRANNKYFLLCTDRVFTPLRRRSTVQ